LHADSGQAAVIGDDVKRLRLRLDLFTEPNTDNSRSTKSIAVTTTGSSGQALEFE